MGNDDSLVVKYACSLKEDQNYNGSLAKVKIHHKYLDIKKVDEISEIHQERRFIISEYFYFLG